MNDRITQLLRCLNFAECVQLFEQLPPGTPIIDWVFDRMEELDSERFDRFLDGKDY